MPFNKCEPVLSPAAKLMLYWSVRTIYIFSALIFLAVNYGLFVTCPAKDKCSWGVIFLAKYLSLLFIRMEAGLFFSGR